MTYTIRRHSSNRCIGVGNRFLVKVVPDFVATMGRDSDIMVCYGIKPHKVTQPHDLLHALRRQVTLNNIAVIA
jgi:hypothetical protein